MQRIYHAVPSTMVGTAIYPLNELKESAPEVYSREVMKYSDHPDRMRLPTTGFSALACRWNDVVHCSPIHPHLLYEAWRRVGMDVRPDRRFFVIPIGHVSHLPMAIMRKQGDERTLGLVDPDSYQEITSVPGETVNWYAKLARNGRSGADFVGVPHVLVHGSIDIANLEIVRWGDDMGLPK